MIGVGAHAAYCQTAISITTLFFSTNTRVYRLTTARALEIYSVKLFLNASEVVSSINVRVDIHICELCDMPAARFYRRAVLCIHVTPMDVARVNIKNKIVSIKMNGILSLSLVPILCYTKK